MNNYARDNADLEPGAIVDCPTCGLPAEIIDRFTLGGAPEPVEHVKVVCVRRHWYTLAVDMFLVSTARTHLGSHRQPLSSSQTMASPSPATPLFPWSAFRQYSPGS
jgi:hypothetical protein